MNDVKDQGEVRDVRAELARLLLENGADHSPDNYGNTPLHGASASGKLQVVRVLLEYGADFTADHQGRTPLHKACQSDHGDIVRELIEQGADPFTKDNVRVCMICLYAIEPCLDRFDLPLKQTQVCHSLI